MGQIWRQISGSLACPGRSVAPSPPPFVYGTTKPTATNTGYAPGTTFTEITSDLTITTPGTAYTNTMFRGGKVQVKAAGVTFTNCWFRGQQAAGVTTDPFVRAHWNAAIGTVFSRCTFGEAGQVGYPDCGVLGWSLTVDRCDISRCVDGVRNVNSDTASNVGDITVKGTYIHDLIYQVPSTDGADNQSHNDCIQLVGGDNISILGNTLHAYVDPYVGSSATPGVPLLSATDVSGEAVTGSPYAWMTPLIITPNQAVGAISIDQNWLEGGQFAANIATKNAALWTGAAVSLTSNRFGRDTRIGKYDLVIGNAVQTYITRSGNTFPDGTLVPVTNGG
jgi:hypothetical protein